MGKGKMYQPMSGGAKKEKEKYKLTFSKSPKFGIKFPDKIFIIVDLPIPFGPKSPSTVPSSKLGSPNNSN